MALKTCAVSAIVHAPDGSPVTNAIVMAELSQRVMQDGVVVPERVVQRTDASGMATLNLWPNAAQDEPKTWYTVIISTPQGNVDTFYITVPDAATANLQALERIEIPDGQDERVARLVATLAQIQKETKGDAAAAESALQQINQKISDFDARVKAPEIWEDVFVSGKDVYPLAGATIKEAKFYDVVANGIPQRPGKDYQITIDEADPSQSTIKFIGTLPIGRNWWAVTRTIINQPGS